ncbi:MAG: crotonase/enoyl-CoA hydratase family protein [Pseudomonadota bacterium]
MGVSIDKNGPVWTVIHDRPKARNAMDRNSAVALHDAFLAFDDSDASVAVLWGKGGGFCSGWDLKLAASLQDADTRAAYFDDHAFPQDADAPPGPGALGPTRLELSKPVIAAVEGPAVAGGMELALWADMRVMAEDAYLGVYCRRWGITLMDGGTVRLPRLVGQGKALEIALTGRKVPAAECAQIGLCERVVPSGEARAAAEALAAEIARFPQAAVRADRRAIIQTRGLPIREALEVEWAGGLAAIRDEGVFGAARFASGIGRHGDFNEI